jgi:hypothetical protein
MDFMQKTLILSFVAIIVTHSSNSFGMLKYALHTHKYIRMYRIKALDNTNILNTVNAPNESELLKHLCDRNNKTITDLKQQIKILEQQNDIANSCPLDIQKLKYLEIQIYEGFSE